MEVSLLAVWNRSNENTEVQSVCVFINRHVSVFILVSCACWCVSLLDV